MNDFSISFENQKTEINEYFDLLRFLEFEENENHSPAKKVFKTLRGNAYLILYNFIEGTVSTGINEIFLALNQDNLPFVEFIPIYQKLWLQYKAKCFEIAKSESNIKNKFSLNSEEELFSELSKFKIYPFYTKDRKGKFTQKTEDYDAYLNAMDIEDISGNLDIRTLKNLAKKYGFSPPLNEIFLFLKDTNTPISIPSDKEDLPFHEYLDKPFTYSVLSKFAKKGYYLPEKDDIDGIRIANLVFLHIKEKRNKLAHGNESFSTAGTNIDFTELYQMKEVVLAYLTEFVTNIQHFIDNKGYKHSTPTP